MPEQKPVPDRSSLSPRRSKRQVLPGKHAQADGLQLRSYDVGALPLLKRIVERMQLRRILSEHLPRCVGSAEMGQTALLVKLVTGNKNCEWIYRFWANPGRPWGGIVPPAPVLAPGSALGSRPRVALSSAQAPSMLLSRP